MVYKSNPNKYISNPGALVGRGPVGFRVRADPAPIGFGGPR
jgi:hypothetical protein